MEATSPAPDFDEEPFDENLLGDDDDDVNVVNEDAEEEDGEELFGDNMEALVYFIVNLFCPEHKPLLIHPYSFRIKVLHSC